MRVGFAICAHEPDIEVQVFGSPGDSWPANLTLHHTSDGCAVLLGRLYYRQELAARFPDTDPQGIQRLHELNDAALAFEVYGRFGLKGLQWLEGDFSLVLWDGRANQFVGMRDPLGGYPLFWISTRGGTAFSNRLNSLTRILPGRSVDLDYLAEYLMLPGCLFSEVQSEGCAFEGIRRVKPGTIICVGVSNRSVEQRPLRGWADDLEDLASLRLEEVASRHAALLREAVRQRLHGPTACQLSGGMDSTSIALLARDWLASGVSKPPLHTVSTVYSKLRDLARETPYLDYASAESGMHPHRIDGDELLSFDAYADPPPHDEPCSELHQLAGQRALAEAAAAAGAKTLLTGEGGDDLLDIQPHYIADFVKQGRLRQAWKEAAAWAQAEGCSLRQILYSYAIAPLLPAWIRPGWRASVAWWIRTLEVPE